MDNPLEILQGGIRLYAESQLDAIKEALVTFQQKSDTKAAVMNTMTYTSNQVCQRLAEANLLFVQTEIINSSRLLSFIFMMRPRLRKYSKIS